MILTDRISTITLKRVAQVAELGLEYCVPLLIFHCKAGVDEIERQRAKYGGRVDNVGSRPQLQFCGKKCKAPVLDMSYPAMVHLFDGKTHGGCDLACAVVEKVPYGTPLGPVP